MAAGDCRLPGRRLHPDRLRRPRRRPPADLPRRRANNLVGLVHANLLVGISFGWWVARHNRHHSNPNHQDLDPDIDIPALASTTGQARDKRGLARVVARYQAFLFFPLLLLTSRNVRGNRLVDWLLGGLNYQIEHHFVPEHAPAELAPRPTASSGVLEPA